LILELEKKRPEMLQRMAVIDFNSQNREKFESKGIAFSYGDISMPDVIAYHESATLIVSTVPDAILSGTSNAQLVETAKEVFPNSQVMAIASNVDDADVIYEAGADYVLMITKLGAERIAEILVRVPVDTLNLDSSLKELKGSDNPHIRRLSMQKATIRSHAKALTGGP
jgi:voltage-gated potassium channel Kch